MKFPLQFILGDSRTQTILGEVHISQDYQVNDATGEPVPLGRWRGNDDEAPSYEDAVELVRRANAYDELIEMIRELETKLFAAQQPPSSYTDEQKAVLRATGLSGPEVYGPAAQPEAPTLADDPLLHDLQKFAEDEHDYGFIAEATTMFNAKARIESDAKRIRELQAALDNLSKHR